MGRKRKPAKRKPMPPPTRVTPDKRRKILERLRAFMQRKGLYD